MLGADNGMITNRWQKKLMSVFLVFVMCLTVAIPVFGEFWKLSGELMIHDPSMIKEGNKWWVFGTGEIDGNGIRVLTSDNGTQWSQAPTIFPQPLAWWKQYVPDHTSAQWAPDIQFFNGRYWLYYSVSSFGSNNSLIGLLSTDSISSGKWRDDGLVIRSTTQNDYNAIDGDLVIDADGNPWLSFGSFWSGIKLTRLDAKTMKPTGQLYSIAARPDHPERAIEAPNITYKDGYYYLFVSFDKCCKGVESTYKIAYGRSTNITGPYLDQKGVDMLKGGGTILDSGNSEWIGPGHQDVYNNNIIIRHAYQASNNGVPRMLINDLYWDSNGWPTYDINKAGIISGAKYKLINRASGKAADVSGKSTTDGADVVQWTDNGGTNQQWIITSLPNGFNKLTNVNSKKVLEIHAWSTANSGDAVQYSDLGGNNQQWSLVPLGNGYYKIINRHSGKALDGYGTSNGSDIIQYDYHGGNNQQWQLVKVD